MSDAACAELHTRTRWHRDSVALVLRDMLPPGLPGAHPKTLPGSCHTHHSSPPDQTLPARQQSIRVHCDQKELLRLHPKSRQSPADALLAHTARRACAHLLEHSCLYQRRGRANCADNYLRSCSRASSSAWRSRFNAGVAIIEVPAVRITPLTSVDN